MASRLTTSAAHLTISAEAQAIEDRLAALARPATATPDRPARFDDAAAAEFAAIDEQLATLKIPYEEWEVLYRQRLQVERDLRAGAMAGDAVLGAETPGVAARRRARRPRGPRPPRPVRCRARSWRQPRTSGRSRWSIAVAGPDWRWAARAASVATTAAQEAIRARDEADEAANGPVASPPRTAEAIEATDPPARTATQEPSATS